jgi:hypothetical protein
MLILPTVFAQSHLSIVLTKSLWPKTSTHDRIWPISVTSGRTVKATATSLTEHFRALTGATGKAWRGGETYQTPCFQGGFRFPNRLSRAASNVVRSVRAKTANLGLV